MHVLRYGNFGRYHRLEVTNEIASMISARLETYFSFALNCVYHEVREFLPPGKQRNAKPLTCTLVNLRVEKQN